MKSSEEQFRRCLVRWFRADLCPFPYLCSSKIMVTNLWSLKRGVKKSTFGRTLLFDFEDISNIEWMLAKGSRRLEEKVLHLVKWILEVGCLLKGRLLGSWVRVLGLPLHLWNWEVPMKLGDYCGVFVTVDEDVAHLTHL